MESVSWGSHGASGSTTGSSGIPGRTRHWPIAERPAGETAEETAEEATARSDFC